MKYDYLTRRQFLRGAAGFSLAVPFLPSLAPAKAQVVSSVPPRLIYLYWGHGGVNSASDNGDFFPHRSRLNWTTRSLIGDTNYRQADLPLNLGGNEQISDVFGPEFNPDLGKMTFIEGMDILQYLGHCRYPFGGVADGVNGKKTTQTRTPTVDQVIARSPSFYPGSYAGKRSVHYEPLGRGHSPSAIVGPDNKMESMPSTRHPKNAFRDLFGSSMEDSGGGSEYASVVDKVMVDYQNLRKSSRLSAFDRGRLDQHIQGLSDIQRQLAASKGCKGIPEPASIDGLDPHRSVEDGIKYASIFNNVLVSGLQCDLTRIGIYGINGLAPGFPANNRHHEMWHKWDEVDGQNYIKEAVKYYFTSIVYDLVKKLDSVIDVDGRTLLDNTLVVVMAENSVPHNNYAHPIVTFGGGGGRFATGKYLDYSHPLLAFGTWSGHAVYAGIPKQTFFNSVLQGFSVPPSEYEQPRVGIYQHGGYSAQYVEGDWGGDSDRVQVDSAGNQYMKKKKKTIYEHWKSSGIINIIDQTLPGFYL